MPTVVFQTVYSGDRQTVLKCKEQARALAERQKAQGRCVISISETVGFGTEAVPTKDALPAGDFWIPLWYEAGQAIRNQFADAAGLDHGLSSRVFGALGRACDDARGGFELDPLLKQVEYDHANIRLRASDVLRLLESDSVIAALRGSTKIQFGPKLELLARQLVPVLRQHLS